MSSTGSTTVRRAGGSLIATIPKEVAEQERLREGDEVVLTVRRRDAAWSALVELLSDLGRVDSAEYRGRDRY